MTVISRNVPFLAIVGLFLFLACLDAQDLATGRLLQLITTEIDIETADEDDIEEFLRAAVNAGPAAVPALRDLVKSSTRSQRLLAVAALATVGGNDAVSILREAYESGDVEVKAPLASALGSANSPENRSLLMRILNDNADFDDPAPMYAALSLGLLRAPEAAEVLRALTNQRSNAFTSEAVEQALQWIETGFWTVNLHADIDDRGRIVAAAMKNGIPHLEEDQHVIDKSSEGFWKYEPSGWTFFRNAPPGEAGAEFDTFISSDGMRAMASVVIDRGLRGYEYKYLLNKEDGEWKIWAVLLASLSIADPPPPPAPRINQ